MPFSDEFEKLLQSWKQMDVDRKLREELRMDSQRLHEEFREEYRKRRKRPYGESHPYNAFIPRRFEDLKLNGGIKLRRIPIKLIYHKAKFKKRKRGLMRENRDPSVTQKLEISTNSLRLGVKSVGMKNQCHRKKRTTQVKLAQACKSVGMFCEFSGCRDTKNELQIRVRTRQIVDTGVKRETHLFRFGLTCHALMEIHSHVDTWIGDQSIFAEEVKALKHDDPEAVMKSLQDEATLESESKSTSKYKSPVELSPVQQQKEQRRFHKVRFKGRRHLRKALYTGRVVLQKKVSHKARKKDSVGGDGEDSSQYLSLLFGNWKEVSDCVGCKGTKPKCWSNCCEELDPSRELYVWDPGQNETAKRPQELLKNTTGPRIDDTSDFYVQTQHNEFRNNLSLKTRNEDTVEYKSQGALKAMKNQRVRRIRIKWVYHRVRKRVKPLGAVEMGSKILSASDYDSPEVKRTHNRRSTRGMSTKRNKMKKLYSKEKRLWNKSAASVERGLFMSKDNGEFGIGYPWDHEDLQEDTGEFEIGITDQKRSIHMVKKSMEMWAKESNSDQAELLKGVNGYCEGGGTGSQNPNVDSNRVWNPGALVVEEDKSYSSVIAEMLWIAEYRRIFVMNVHTSSENEVKWVVVLSVDSQKSLSSYEYVITVPAFGLWSLEDKAVIRPGSKLRLYGELVVKRRHTSKNTPLLPSVFTHGPFQSPRPPELLFSYCRKITSDTERLESLEVMRNKIGRDGCSGRAWNNERCVMGCENRDVQMHLFVTVLATFWPVFELLSAVFVADFRARLNLCVISLINTKGVRVTGSQTYDLLDGSHAMKIDLTSLCILKMQVIYRIINGDVSAVLDGRWTLNLNSDWFHSPRPPDICMSEHYGSWRILSKERAIAFNLVDKVVSTGEY